MTTWGWTPSMTADHHLHPMIQLTDHVIDEWGIDHKRYRDARQYHRSATGNDTPADPIETALRKALDAAEQLRATLMVEALRQGVYTVNPTYIAGTA